MTVVLQKGQNISLSQANATLNKLHVGLGWDKRDTKGAAFDLDASAFLLDTNDKVHSDADFIFYNQLMSACGSVRHTGDNRTGSGEGDDEVILVDLERVPADVQKVVFVVTIHEAKRRWQHFGMVQNAYIRIANAEDRKELVRYNLTEEASIAASMVFGELYRHKDEWKFKAIGQGYAAGLKVLAENFGVDIG